MKKGYETPEFEKVAFETEEVCAGSLLNEAMGMNIVGSLSTGTTPAAQSMLFDWSAE